MTGLVGYWPLHRTVGDAIDLSGEGNDGTITGATRGVAGRGGLQAFSFDGTDDNVDATTLGNFGSNMDTDLSISFWVKTTSTAVDTAYMGTYDGTDTFLFIRHNVSGSAGNVEFALRDQDSDEITVYTGGGLVNDGKWHHVVCVKASNSASGLSIYIDGSSVSVTTDNNQAFDNVENFDHPMLFGARNNGGTAEWFMDINLCNVRFFDRALSSGEITRLYEFGAGDYARPPSDLDDTDAVSYWDLNEDPANTSTAADSWGSNDGSITGASQADPAIRGTGMSFDGTDDRVDIPDSSSLELASDDTFTISAWMRTDTNADGAVVGKSESSGPYHGYWTGYFDENGDNSSEYIIYVKDSNGYTLVSIPAYHDNEWRHRAVVVNGADGNDWKIYENGVEQPTTVQNNAYGGGVTTTVNGAIGARNGGGGSPRFSGEVDDVRLYSRALSPAEIHDVYQYGTFGRDLRAETVGAV